MGCMFRSDEISLCDLYLTPEIAFELLSALGEMGCVQIIDTHPDLQLFQRSFVQEICRCYEMERKLIYAQKEAALHNIPIPSSKQEPKAAPIHDLMPVETKLEKWVHDIREITRNEEQLMENDMKLKEMLYVLKHVGPFLGKEEITTMKAAQSHKAATKNIEGFVVVTGVVRRKNAYAFEMVLWRISRGMIYYRQADEDKIFTNPLTNHEVRKVAFLAICQGEKLEAVLEKVCSGFRVNTYTCPDTFSKRNDMIEQLTSRVDDMEKVLKNTRYLRCKALLTLSKQWDDWNIIASKSKAVYYQLNKFNLDISKKFLIGQAWVPDSDVNRVRDVIAECCKSRQSTVDSVITKVEHKLQPPTFNRVNKFTSGFQNLINAYGTSAYRELNPGLYTVITFPFLFGIMFGDVGHGLLMFIFAAWMCITEEKHLATKSTNEIWNIIFAGRYIVLLMGAFSIYTGALYNDMFGIKFTFMSSYFKNHLSVDQLKRDRIVDIDPAKRTGSVYVLGLDPIWGLAKNKIMVENSTKMKLSIIIGIIHMIFGVSLSLVNYRYFKRYYSIPLQFIPEIVFLCAIFLWLVFLIVYKWFMYSALATDQELGTACAPQVLILFIDMALFSESKPVNDCQLAYMFEGQRMIQMILMVVAMLMVPILLFGTPVYLLRSQRAKKENAERELEIYKLNHAEEANTDDYLRTLEQLETDVEEHSHSFGDLMIHQGVHTIEYVLSTISHTASYLRLWALSLAHAQLAEMLYHMVFSKLALKDHSKLGALKIYVIFAVWAAFSLSILVIMEGLSAFLHTLRLHWVEFMSKFFKGEGYLFLPFSFKRILAEAQTNKTEAGCAKLAIPDDGA